MNWTGGRLHRHVRYFKNKDSQKAREKRSFANAKRSGLRKNLCDLSPIRVPGVLVGATNILNQLELASETDARGTREGHAQKTDRSSCVEECSQLGEIRLHAGGTNRASESPSSRQKRVCEREGPTTVEPVKKRVINLNNGGARVIAIASNGYTQCSKHSNMSQNSADQALAISHDRNTPIQNNHRDPQERNASAAPAPAKQLSYKEMRQRLLDTPDWAGLSLNRVYEPMRVIPDEERNAFGRRRPLTEEDSRRLNSPAQRRVPMFRRHEWMARRRENAWKEHISSQASDDISIRIGATATSPPQPYNDREESQIDVPTFRSALFDDERTDPGWRHSSPHRPFPDSVLEQERRPIPGTKNNPSIEDSDEFSSRLEEPPLPQWNPAWIDGAEVVPTPNSSLHFASPETQPIPRQTAWFDTPCCGDGRHSLL